MFYRYSVLIFILLMSTPLPESIAITCIHDITKSMASPPLKVREVSFGNMYRMDNELKSMSAAKWQDKDKFATDLWERTQAFEDAFNAKVREILSHLQKLPLSSDQKARLWIKYARVLKKFKKNWGMEKAPTAKGEHFFYGSTGYSLYIDPKGNLYKGVVSKEALEAIKSQGPRPIQPSAIGLRAVSPQ